MRILITGAFGYVGYSLVHELLEAEESHELILYDNLQKGNINFFHSGKSKNAGRIQDLYFNDLLDNKALTSALSDVETVIHLAAKVRSPFSDSHVHSFDQINNWGTAVLADAIESAENVKRVIYLSSVSVYGDTLGKVIDEDHIPDPLSFYGISKLRGENHIRRLGSHIQKIIVRSGNVFGYNPCFRLDSVINRFAFEAHYKKKILIRGSGEQQRAFVSVQGLSTFLASLISLEEPIPEIINHVEHNLSVMDIAEAVFEVWDKVEYVHSVNHMKMRSIAATSKYNGLFSKKPITLVEVLEGFRRKFFG